ncbi:RagB/SusD family nutrient uptake outer membrane protein [Pararcticibacter amylolyticus]|uniref:RagB/SusD family nutrient uptake outer membrane protein n=1 Tax=Pararcticibacter amylolyticus TaxID=2173175 RepID=A0A2U2PE81_9SPHI|nr:RagB/SusD family nutrient uptake outer membrane protein [Pararcticibacter amylolyticus]PWG79708.1 RagB/SusD family nutrient uptake outer membrane protein [Pararcticibacter amylolyticus]
MKINKYIYMLVALVAIATGCKDDFLEEKRDYGAVDEETFRNPVLAQAYVDYVYGMFLPAGNAQAFIVDQSATDNGGYNNVFTQTTEELAGETTWNKVWAKISYEFDHADKYFGQRMGTSMANNTWTRLREINVFLTEVDKYGMADDVKNKLKGQLYFWRGWQYFQLWRLYGGVPIVLTPQQPTSDAQDTKTPRSTSEETLNQIIADLDMAQSLLPGSWPSSDWGRITSGGAAALKGRALLTWASPLFNRNDDKTRWQRAYDANLAAKNLLEANGFGLYKTGSLENATAWGNMFLQEVSNPEAVIVFGFNNVQSGNAQKNNGWEQAIRPRSAGGSGSISPTREMIESFPMKDGKMAGSSAYTYDQNKFYKNRDPRFYKTFVYTGASWPYVGTSGVVNFRLWNYVWKQSASASSYNGAAEANPNASGVYICKASNPSASSALGNFNFSGTDFMEMRFAEVVLNLAESAIGSDKLMEGRNLIRSIRERAGVENLDGNYGLSNITDRDDLFAAVLNERKVEFAYENKRFWDLRRWMLFGGDEVSDAILARLKMRPLNGTRRTGYRIVVKKTDGTDYVGTANPLIAGGLADRETTPIDELYDKYLKVTSKDDLDPTNPAGWKFTWYKEYYFFGLHQNVLTSSPYLEQTTGWNSLNGMGTFDPLK